MHKLKDCADQDCASLCKPDILIGKIMHNLAHKPAQTSAQTSPPIPPQERETSPCAPLRGRSQDQNRPKNHIQNQPRKSVMDWLHRLRNELNDRRLGIHQTIVIESSALPLHHCTHGPAYRYTSPDGTKHHCKLCRAIAHHQRRST